MSQEETTLAAPTSITDLKPKMKVEGIVKRIGLYGAFVDIGVERDGLIHISQLSDRHVEKVSDIVSEGDRVTAWVIQTDPDQGRIGLSLVEPPDVAWKDLKEGQSYTGKIVRMEKYGVFVDIGAERPGLLHVRDIANSYVRHPSEIFHDGDEVEVNIREIDRRRKRIDLSMVDLTADYLDEEDEGEELATPMEIAFRKAQQQSGQRPERGATASKSRRKEQDNILARTLEQHG